MGKGKRYELNLKNNINENTEEWVKAHRPDFSGNSTGEVADVMVVWPQHVAYIEAKKRSGVDEGNRKVVISGSSDGQSGLEELQELRSESPSWTDQYVVVKFPNREAIVLDAKQLEHWLRRDEEGYGGSVDDVPEAWLHGARLTPSNNISMVKPTLEGWPSATAGMDDWKKVATTIGLEEYDVS